MRGELVIRRTSSPLITNLCFVLSFAFVSAALFVTQPVHAQSACDQLLSELPKRGPDRIAAGKPCLAELPDISKREQTRIVRDYAKRLPGYIEPAHLDAVVESLPADVALPLAAHAARFSAIGSGQDKATQVEQLIKRANQRNDELAKAHIEFLLAARLFRSGGDTEVMQAHLEQAMGLAQKTQANGLIPYITNALAVRAKVDGQYDLAIARYRESLGQFEVVGDLGSTGIAYANIGSIFSDLGDSRQAINMYERAIDIYLEYAPEQDERLATAYTNLGTAHADAADYEQSNASFKRARQYSSRLETRRLDGLINYQNALTLFKTGARDKAIDMVQTAIGQILEHRDPSEAATALNWLAARQIEDRDLEAARVSLEWARSIMEPEGTGAQGLLANPGNTYWAQEYAASMGSLLMALGQEAEASEYLDVALSLSDERFEREKMSAVVNSELLFDVRDRDLRLELMEDEAVISELKLRQSRLQFFTAIAAVIAVAMAAFAIYRAYQSQRQEVRTKDLFLKEIHHRTKNNLQLLTSLLNLNARRTEYADDQHHDAANRARTMALIHEHIYAQEAPNSILVDVNDFIDNLLVLLERSYGREDIQLTWHANSEGIDVDDLTPLGLLISEIVTNSYKHGFADRTGTIDLSFEAQGSGFQLTVSDNGSGFANDPAKGETESLGMALIEDLVEQLQATRDLTTSSAGTIWTITSKR